MSRFWSNLRNGSLGFLLFASCAPLILAQANYHLTVLAKDGDAVDGVAIRLLGSGIGMNNQGRVVFDAAQAFNAGVYQATSSSPATFVGLGQFPQIDNSGTILFRCQAGLCTQSGTVVATGQTIGGLKLQGIDNAALSGNGHVVFIGEAPGPNGVFPNPPTNILGLFTPTGLLVKGCEFQIFQQPPSCLKNGAPGDSIAGKQLLAVGSAAIDNSGALAFTCGFQDGTAGLCDLSGILVSQGSVIGGLTVSNLELPSLDNSKRLVFTADYAGNNKGVFTPSSVLVQAGDTFGGVTTDAFFGSYVQNDSGNLLFRAHIPNVGEALFTSSGVVLRQGDPFDGKTIAQFGHLAISDNGDIAFFVEFTDHTQAVVFGKRI